MKYTFLALALATMVFTATAHAHCQTPNGIDDAQQLQDLLNTMANLPTTSRTVALCPNTVWNLTRAVVVPAAASYTKIHTAGYPTDS